MHNTAPPLSNCFLVAPKSHSSPSNLRLGFEYASSAANRADLKGEESRKDSIYFPHRIVEK